VELFLFRGVWEWVEFGEALFFHLLANLFYQVNPNAYKVPFWELQFGVFFFRFRSGSWEDFLRKITSVV
jgi:hypothetical protein